MQKYDLIVVGAGPAGYVGAIRGAQLGMRVALIEKDALGGTCLNRGCIPTKSLLHSAELYYLAKNQFAEDGILAEGLTLDFEQMYRKKDEAVSQLAAGIEQLLKANKVDLFAGKAKVLADGKAEVKNGEETLLLSAEHLLLCTGAEPAKLGIPGNDLPGVLTSDDVLQKPVQGQHIVIVGAGVIGVELACYYGAVGKKVTMLEYAPRVLPGTSRELGQSAAMLLKKRGVEIITAAGLNEINTASEGKLNCLYTCKENPCMVSADAVIMAVGRKPVLAHVLDDGLVVEREKDLIKVDKTGRSSLPWLYAAGDIVPGPQLAHWASAQAVAAVEAMAGKTSGMNMDLVPACIYTTPEMAWVGMSEQQAAASGRRLVVHKFLMGGNGRTVIAGGERSYVKLMADEETGRLLGAELLCERASDLIAVCVVAIQNKMQAKQLGESIWAHPTFAEALGEAGELFGIGAIHAMPKAKGSQG